ncbi:MAG: hypothetical protein MPW15_13780 [Candidatus Manganitrophus sp.]|nr:hypothetical protein [Candidatus Manganitrophus sp.]
MSFGKNDKGGISFVLSLLLSIAITACGGDGDNSGGGGSSSNQGVQSSGAASKAVIDALEAAQNAGAGNHTGGGGDGEGGTSGKPSLKGSSGSDVSDPAEIRVALEGFKRSLKQRKQKTLQAPSTENLPCSSGSGTLTTDDKGTDDSTDDTFSFSAVNCQLAESGVTALLNGSFSIEPNEGGFRLTFSNFLFRETDSAGRMDESQTNGTLDFVGEDEGCGEQVFLKNGTLTANLTNSRKLNENGDQVLELDESSTMTNFVLHVAETHAPVDQGCTPGATTLTLNGTSSFTNALEANDNFTATFNGFQMVLTPATRTIEGVERTGVTMALSGSVAIASECANGTFTVSTPAEDLPFIPDDDECAVQGRILVSDGTNTTAVIATSTGGVQIDNGNNGSVDREFSDCNEAEACAENV